MIKERPILFSSEMVEAILAGCKTTTRRIIKQKVINIIDGLPIVHTGKAYKTGIGVEVPEEKVLKCPFGSPGDVLYVREPFTEYYQEHGLLSKWKPAVRMPKEAARIWLRVTFAMETGGPHAKGGRSDLVACDLCEGAGGFNVCSNPESHKPNQ